MEEKIRTKNSAFLQNKHISEDKQIQIAAQILTLK